jgi:hypothetical protein
LVDIHAADGNPIAFTGSFARTREENEANAESIVNASNELERILKLLKSARDLAKEAFDAWDSDQDMKVGKILRALSGELPGYRADTDLINAAIIDYTTLQEVDNPV